MSKSELPITEELDFEYLLELMPPLHDEVEFAWLPELFSIIGYRRLIMLTKYAGGESIKIPTLKQLSESIEALQWFYNVKIKKTNDVIEVPIHLLHLYNKICKCYDRDIENS